MQSEQAIAVVLTDTACRLELRGELTIALARDLRSEALRALSARLPITVDLSTVSYLDASCLQVLQALRSTAGSGSSVTVTGATTQVLDDARMLGMQGVLHN